jgi:prepilin-type processing-associated H-X9-DG protein
MAEMEPAGTVAWTDDAGLHARAITPFPGAEVIGQGGNTALASVGEESMLISILLPSLNRARETANRVKCANNLKQIGLGLALYTNEHRGAYPPDLGTLLATEDLTAAVFCCPSTNTQVPPNLAPAEAVQWANANSDYIYLGGALKAAPPPDTVIAYEKDADHGGDGMNLLFADGHVEFDLLQAAHQQIARTKQLLGQ